ncbi:hypothetical protein FXO38_32916 [Capsicum annuum]|uniref:Uncharacterized protein n=1 Tax=Capsicum annuum TaxID=4072 RepID=A0A2G3A966_CAPAN|nr:hypothetical protein FXO38_32916 [Capsicum annuum]PHT90796.1 hypothetical protein T459_05909 [Capsicum annuum]
MVGHCYSGQGDAVNDDGNEGELSMCSYGKESLGRLAIALGGSVIVPNLPSTIFNFLDHEDWQIHYSVVTAIGVISEGCSKVVIHAVGQLSMHMSLQFQEPYHQLVLPDLIAVLDDFDNPRLQSGMTMMNEAALTTLGSLAIQSQKGAAYIYDSVMPHLKVILVAATSDTSQTLHAKYLGTHYHNYNGGRYRTRLAARNSYGGRRSNEVPFVTIRVETRCSLKELHEQIVYIDDEFMCFLLYRVIPLATVIKFSCKIINVRFGAELPEKCRELALHFENQGTPAMIGRSYSYCNMLLAPSDAASGSISPMNVRISRDDNDPNDILRFRCICLGYSIMMM